MKHIEIENPCSEIWNKMNPTAGGAFCQKCSKEVIDFESKSADEIKTILRRNLDQSICGRISNPQLEALNLEFESWKRLNSKNSFQSKFVFTLVLVFGLTLFSCNSDDDKKVIVELQEKLVELVEAEPIEEIDSEASVPLKILADKKSDKIESDKEFEEQIQQNISMLEDTIQELDTVEIIGEALVTIHTYVGMMSVSSCFVNFLEEDMISDEEEFDENGLLIPKEYSSNLYPNPILTQASLEIALPKEGYFVIQIFDITGKWIQALNQTDLKKGTHRFLVDMSSYPSGTYLITIQSQEYNETLRFQKLDF
jgi:hypothetical protein